MRNFFKRKNNPRILDIELADLKLNEQIGKLMVDFEKNLEDFKLMINKNRFLEKDEEAEELLNSFLSLTEKIDTLLVDVEKIQNIEVTKREYLHLNDESFLADKKKQLTKIRNDINGVIEIIKERPSAKEYKKELFDIMKKKVAEIKISLKTLRKDDEKLNKIYSSLIS